jgi:HCOMODA/2-hydroxy-3-carboxy-muconic semialdehyde decarboxylase
MTSREIHHQQTGNAVAKNLDDARYQVALANRILANEDVLDAFGHVSIRHPDNPGRYLCSRSRSPEVVEPADILEYTLDSKLVKPTTAGLYAERVIHGEIYKARPDVMAVCHHHAPAVLPFCIAGVPVVPVFHLGACAGEEFPFWDQHDEFGDTNLLVVKAEEGASLARALGSHNAVLMRKHGVTAVGSNVQNLVLRCIAMCLNAKYQLAAKMLGHVATLTSGEAKMAGKIAELPIAVDRTWEYWSRRLDKARGMPPRAVRAAKSAAPRSRTRTKVAEARIRRGKPSRKLARRLKRAHKVV